MKRAEKSGTGLMIAAGGVVVAVATLLGHIKGTADGRSDARVRSDPPRSDRLAEHDAGSESVKGTVDAGALKKLQARLWKAWRETPEPMLDPEASTAIYRLMEKMTSEQIAEFLTSFSPDSGRDENWQLRQAVLLSWMMQDAPAVIRYLAAGPATGPQSSMETTQLVMQWTEDQPDAALEWMSRGDVPEDQKKAVSLIRLNSLMVLMNTNPDRAFDELKRMDPEDVSKQLKLWAGTHGADEKMRDKLLEISAASGTPGDLEKVTDILLRALAEKDPGAAEKFMESQATDASTRKAMELAVTMGRASKEPAAAFDTYMEKNDLSGRLPEAIVFGIGSWMWKDADAAVRWLDQQPAGEKRDALYAGSILPLAGYDRFDKAAEIARGIGSSELRGEAMHQLNLRWSLVNAEAAERWRAGLAAEDRAAMER